MKNKLEIDLADILERKYPRGFHAPESPGGATAMFDTNHFPCNSPQDTNPCKAEVQGNMPQAQFIGDEWHCECGNQPHTDGFQPCQKTGRVVWPTPDTWTDSLYRCMRCDKIIAWDDAADCGKIVGMTAPGFLDQTEP